MPNLQSHSQPKMVKLQPDNYHLEEFLEPKLLKKQFKIFNLFVDLGEVLLEKFI